MLLTTAVAGQLSWSPDDVQKRESDKTILYCQLLGPKPPWRVGLDHLCTLRIPGGPDERRGLLLSLLPWGCPLPRLSLFLTPKKGEEDPDPSCNTRPLGDKFQEEEGIQKLKMKTELSSSFVFRPKVPSAASVCPALSLVHITVPLNLDSSTVLLTDA